jgi:hypothetical protein
MVAVRQVIRAKRVLVNFILTIDWSVENKMEV